MKIEITYNDKKYNLGFTRATALEMAKVSTKLNKNSKEANVDAAIQEAETIIKYSLHADQPNLPKEEVEQVVKFVMDNYQLVDKENNGIIEKGLITYLTDIIMGCMPKGFTGQATMKFVVVE